MSYLRTFSTLGCPGLNLEEVLALAASHALPGVEIRALGGTIDLPAHFESAYGTPAVLAERICLQHVKVFSLDTSLRLADGSDSDREAFLGFLPWAEALGVPRLRVFDGGHGADEATHRAMAGTVAWWREVRAKNNWRPDIMVETHDALFSGEAINRFLLLAPGTGILWDTHNTWRSSGEDPVATWRAIAPHVVHMHVKDSVGIPSGKHGYSYRVPGEGEFPMAKLREAIRGEFDGPVSLEWERLWHPELAPLEDALEAAERNNWW